MINSVSYNNSEMYVKSNVHVMKSTCNEKYM